VVQRGRFHKLWLLSVLLLSGCALDGPQSIFDTAGPIAEAQKDLFIYISWFALFVTVVVTAVLGYTVYKYRQRGDDDGSVPEQIHGVAWLEALWTAAPAVILVLIGIPTVSLIFRTESRVEPTQEDLIVNVTGYQWWWEFEYPQLGITTANELHIPTGRRVIVNLNSGDVLHSFWVPRLAGKMDLIPNQNNQFWFIADKPDIYHGQCAELCLGAHAYMRFRVVASNEAEFSTWASQFQEGGAQQVQGQPNADQIAAGEALFNTKGCATCHAISGVANGQKAPDLTNFGLRTTVAAGWLPNTPENLAAWLRDPQAVKPGNYMPALWSEDDPKREEEISALVAYLESLGTQEERSASVQAGR
jgi:cytochrome c oxidase subunit 2